MWVPAASWASRGVNTKRVREGFLDVSATALLPGITSGEVLAGAEQCLGVGLSRNKPELQRAEMSREEPTTAVRQARPEPRPCTVVSS